MAYKYFKEKGSKVKVLYASFSHSLKKERIIEEDGFLSIPTREYQKNISIQRVLSHLDFQKGVRKFLSENSFDVIYINLPTNIITAPVITYKQKNQDCFLIIDILDLWPEAFPLPIIIKQVFTNSIGLYQKRVRNTAINFANLVLTESQLFFKELGLDKKANSKVIHLKKIIPTEFKVKEPSEDISIGYLGNIGNIYDFEMLVDILKKIKHQRKVVLKILGDGDRKDWLLNELKKNQIEYEYHQPTFDEVEKFNFLGDCWFGFNGFKGSTVVALSYKSIDYFSFGVPIINSAKGDTELIVEENNMGININSNSISKIEEYLSKVSRSEVKEMKSNVMKNFDRLFSERSFVQELDQALNQKF